MLQAHQVPERQFGYRSKVEVARYFFGRYRPQSLLILLALLSSSLAESVGLMSLLPLLNLTLDQGGSQQTFDVISGLFEELGIVPSLELILAIIVVGMTLKALFHYGAMAYVGYIWAHITADHRIRLIDAIMKARWGFFVSQPAGVVTNAITTEAVKAGATYAAICRFAAGTIQVTVFMGAAMLVSLEVTMVALVAGAGLMLLLQRFVAMTTQAGHRASLSFRALSRQVVDALQVIKPLKAMGREKNLAPLLEDEAQKLNQAQRASVVAKYGLADLREPPVVMLMAAGIYAAVGVLSIQMSTTILLAVLFYRAMASVGQLQKSYQSISSSEAFFWSLYDQINRAEENREQPTADREAPVFERSIRFESVSFAHGDQPILSDAWLEIPANTLTALVGPSGAGKTTVADLVCGLQVPDGGTVWVDDHPLTATNLHDWREQLGYVTQDSVLFHESIADNVSLKDPAITPADIEYALRQADAWDFVSQMPEGVQTTVGERGIRLSGGQVQRLCIARALVRQPRLLILDEATTALDPATEEGIIQTLLKLRRGITILAVSHQPKIVEIADRVYRLENARLESVR